MNTRIHLPLTVAPTDGWKLLFEAALLEHDPRIRPYRLSEAKDAVLDRMEDSFDTASLSERLLLIAALDAIGELERRSSLEPPTSLDWSLERGAA